MTRAQMRTGVKLVLLGVLALCVLTPLLWNWEHGGEYRSFSSPDGRHKVVVVRSRTWFASMPGQSSDTPGWVEIYDLQREKLIARKRIEMVQMVDEVNWSATNVEIKFVGQWQLP
jgi:hypothetical protein